MLNERDAIIKRKRAQDNWSKLRDKVRDISRATIPAESSILDCVRVRVDSEDRYLQEVATGKHIVHYKEYQIEYH